MLVDLKTTITAGALSYALPSKKWDTDDIECKSGVNNDDEFSDEFHSCVSSIPIIYLQME
jgi:hypothetical protein